METILEDIGTATSNSGKGFRSDWRVNSGTWDFTGGQIGKTSAGSGQIERDIPMLSEHFNMKLKGRYTRTGVDTTIELIGPNHTVRAVVACGLTETTGTLAFEVLNSSNVVIYNITEPSFFSFSTDEDLLFGVGLDRQSYAFSNLTNAIGVLTKYARGATKIRITTDTSKPNFYYTGLLMERSNQGAFLF